MTATRTIAREALAIGDFLYVTEDHAFVLVVGRSGPTSAHVLHNTGRTEKLDHLDLRVRVAVEAPTEDFGPVRLAYEVTAQEIEARTAQARAERLRLAKEVVLQIQGNQPGAAAEFARVIGQR